MLFVHLPSNVPHAECVGDAAAPSKKNMKLFFQFFASNWTFTTSNDEDDNSFLQMQLSKAAVKCFSQRMQQ